MTWIPSTNELSAPISASSAGSHVVVPQPGLFRRIVVLGYTLTSTAAQTFQWRGGAENLSGAMTLSANTGFSSASVMIAPADKDLLLDLGGATTIAGHVHYLIQEESPRNPLTGSTSTTTTTTTGP